ncbi:DMT family transporter [soil metagenome]
MVGRMRQSRRSYLLLLAPAIFLVLWSGGFSIAKLGVRHAEPLTFLALRYGIVVLILVPFYIALRPPLPRRAADWGHIAMVGFLIQTVYFGLCYIAFKAGMPAGTLAIIVCLQPIFAGLIAPSFTGERVSPRRWVGLILGLAGASAVIISQGRVGGASPFTILCGVGALAGITGGTLWEKRFGISQHPVIANLIQYVVGAATVLPAALATESLAIQWTPEFTLSLAYLVIGNSLIAMTLLLAMIRAGEVSRVSSLFYLVPPASAIIAWPILGETLGPLAWAGMVLAAVGVAIASRKW